MIKKIIEWVLFIITLPFWIIIIILVKIKENE